MLQQVISKLFWINSLDELPPLVTAKALEDLESQQGVTIPLLPSEEQQSSFDITIAELTDQSESNEENNGRTITKGHGSGRGGITTRF